MMNSAMKSRWLIMGVVLVLLVIGTGLLTRAQTQAEMTWSAEQEAAAADKKLNEVYQRLLHAPTIDDVRRQKLVAAQRAWVRFRDTECVLEGDAARGGSMEAQIRSACASRMTDQRIKTLEQMLSANDSDATTRSAR